MLLELSETAVRAAAQHSESLFTRGDVIVVHTEARMELSVLRY
jgi:hypothetical protein